MQSLLTYTSTLRSLSRSLILRHTSNTKTLQSNNFLNIDLDSIKDMLLKAVYFIKREILIVINQEMRKLIKSILLEVGVENLKIRSRDDNRCESANSRIAQFGRLGTKQKHPNA